MALALDIMKGGVSAGVAKAIQGQVISSITAGTTQTQAGGTAIKASINSVTTVATAGDGVTLPSGEIGDSVEICNLASVPCKVYPPTGEQIGALGANNGFLLASNTAVKIRKFTTTRWMAFLSA